jgi:hypothetical protein
METVTASTLEEHIGRSKWQYGVLSKGLSHVAQLGTLQSRLEEEAGSILNIVTFNSGQV